MFEIWHISLAYCVFRFAKSGCVDKNKSTLGKKYYWDTQEQTRNGKQYYMGDIDIDICGINAGAMCAQNISGTEISTAVSVMGSMSVNIFNAH